jgi:hypothetical protein
VKQPNRRWEMRRLALVLGVLALAGGAATPAAATSDGVVVVGHGSVEGGATATVAAFGLGDQARGLLRVESAPGFVFVSRVTCVRVVGARVLVGGVIVRSPTPATLGHTSLVAIEDGGRGGTDLLGIAFSNSGLDTCPVFDLPMRPVTQGNFFVHA